MQQICGVITFSYRYFGEISSKSSLTLWREKNTQPAFSSIFHVQREQVWLLLGPLNDENLRHQIVARC